MYSSLASGLFSHLEINGIQRKHGILLTIRVVREVVAVVVSGGLVGGGGRSCWRTSKFSAAQYELLLGVLERCCFHSLPRAAQESRRACYCRSSLTRKKNCPP